METSEDLSLLRNFTSSKMPTYRPLDIQKRDLAAQLSERDTHGTQLLSKHTHIRYNSTSDIEPPNSTTQESRPSLKTSRHLSFPTDHSSQARPALPIPQATAEPQKSTTKGKKSNNGPSYPPLSMITRGYAQDSTSISTSTTNWVAQQSISVSPNLATISNDEHTQITPSSSPPDLHSPQFTADNTSTRPPVKVAPIRGFRSSRKSSAEMASRRFSQEPDNARVYETNENLHRRSRQAEQDEHNSDESDLFLRTAREEELAQQQNTSLNTNGNSPSRSDNRRSRTSQRSSLPPSSTAFNSAISRRRGSEDNSNGLPTTMDGQGQETIAQALTYRPAGRDRPAALEDLSRTRYTSLNSRSTPATPRGTGGKETSVPEEYGGRRPSIPDAALPPRNSYRQSNLSYSMPRTYNSSPLVSRTTESHDTSETPRATEGTDSTVSTTAPSTVWDELDELKSRIHRLELTGKLPATSGAAISRASDRPPTATTTITTVSSSPKRGQGNSISPADHTITMDQAPAEAHPLLHTALAKAKPVLSAEVYKALEAAASDALAISSMMGTSGQPGPISSAQSTVGGPNNGVSDRQVRRKTDSMCRSLTELCLALSEDTGEAASTTMNQALVRPRSRDMEVLPSVETSNVERQMMNADLNRVKSSPRALSRLEARRSSLLATSTLPMPRYAPSDVGTPTTGRRTSMFLRTRRTGTEEPEEDDTFRAPSRALTEIGRPRQSPREYTSQQQIPERSSSNASSLPVRRHYASNSGPPIPPVSALNNRRYLDRSTPERDTTSVMGRLAEDRAQRKSSIGAGFPLGRTGSLTRRVRQPTGGESSAGQQGSGYQ